MAVVLILAILLASSIAVIADEPSPDNFDLYFTTGSTQDYVKHHGLRVSTAFTVCFWMRSWSRKTGSVFSYAVKSHDNELLIFNHQSFLLWIGGEHRPTSVTINDGKWHHICATWSNTAGAWKLYKDGVRAASGSNFKKGYTIPSNGVIVLGQEQDNVGGGFEATQSYEGELTQLHVWNRVLSPCEIQYGYDKVQSGKVKSWSEFWAGIHGTVRIISPSACKRCS